MKHYGDITKINGYAVPLVDVITGGSPCQDLSVAGKRAGLAGERSGLFMEQMRIVKEMRDRDVRTGRAGFLVRPRYMVWENVPGAFSSGNPKGSDFQAVLEEIVRVVCKEAPPVPVPKEGWPKAGCISGVGDSGCTFSIAWRVHDAQFWGVPQRRKRIALVADFGGLSAPEILFERKGLSGDSEQSREAGEETAAGAEGGAGSAVYGIDHVITTGGNCTAQGPCFYEDVEATLKAAGPHAVAYGVMSFQERAGKPDGGKGILIQRDHVGALSTQNNQSVLQSAEPILLESNQNQATVQTDGISTALPASMGMGGGYVPMVTEPIPIHDQATRFKGKHGDRTDGKGNGLGVGNAGDPANTLSSADRHAIYDARGNGVRTFSNQAIGAYIDGDKASALKQRDYKDATDLVVAAVDCRNGTENPDTNGTLQAKEQGGYSMNINIVCRTGSIVRRLTPLECERLQGFPDGWTDIGEWTDSNGKKHKDSDSPRYKALGNSIALPFWQYLARRICAQYERQIKMASLFDGIGGFPLVFQRCGAIPVWASEIEEFPIAVTKKHFPE